MLIGLDGKRVAVFTMIVLAVIGALVMGAIFVHRLDTDATKRQVREKRDLDEARLSLSTMGTQGVKRKEFACRPNVHVALHMVQTMCAGSGEIFIEYPSDTASANVRYSTSPGMVYKIDGRPSGEAPSKLSVVQTQTIERMVESCALNLDAQSPEDADVGFPSFPLGMEGCVDGHYFAAERLAGGMDHKFAKLWSGIDKTLKVSLERLPDAPPVMCL